MMPMTLDVVDTDDDGVISPALSAGTGDTISGSWIAQIFGESRLIVEAEGQQVAIVGVLLLISDPDDFNILFAPTDGSVLQAAKYISVSSTGQSTSQFLRIGDPIVPPSYVRQVYGS